MEKKRDLTSFQDLTDKYVLRNQDLFTYCQLREYFNKVQKEG